MVGHTRVDSGSPMQASSSVEGLDMLHLHPGVALSPMPVGGPSPRKRKSSDDFDMCVGTTRYDKYFAL